MSRTMKKTIIKHEVYTHGIIEEMANLVGDTWPIAEKIAYIAATDKARNLAYNKRNPKCTLILAGDQTITLLLTDQPKITEGITAGPGQAHIDDLIDKAEEYGCTMIADKLKTLKIRWEDEQGIKLYQKLFAEIFGPDLK